MNAKGEIGHDRLMTLLLEDPEIVEEFGIEELLELCRVARIDVPNVVKNVKRSIQRLEAEKGGLDGLPNDSSNVVRLSTRGKRRSRGTTAPAATPSDEATFGFAEQVPSRFSVPQRTICNAVSATGVGLHTGRSIRLTLKPLDVGAVDDPYKQGIVFWRTDLPKENGLISVVEDRVSAAGLSITLSNAKGNSVTGIEHLMGTLAGLGIDAALIEVDGPEIPIFDGSGIEFVRLIKEAGIKAFEHRPRRFIKILKRIEVRGPNGEIASLDPAEEIRFDISLNIRPLGLQSLSFVWGESAFESEIAPARMFLHRRDLRDLTNRGRAKGWNDLEFHTFDDERVFAPGGSDFGDDGVVAGKDFARHRLLNTMGDLFTGAPYIIGKYTGVESSHRLNHELIRRMWANPDSWRETTCRPRLQTGRGNEQMGVVQGGKNVSCL